MTSGLNRCLMLGNLGRDAELINTQGGSAILKFSIACTERYLDRNRVRQERTEWVRCVMWGRRAEALAKHLVKGTTVHVEGSLRTSSWEDREGNKRYSTEVSVSNIILVGSKRGGSGGSGSSGGGNGSSNGGGNRGRGAPSGDDDYGSSDPPQRGGYGDDDYGGGSDDDIPF